MWKNLILIGLVILLSSCGAKRKGLEALKESKEVILGKSEAVSYKSLGNGVASISLQLFENNTFKFDFKSIPQPESTEKPVVISEKGTYISDGNWKILSFKKNVQKIVQKVVQKRVLENWQQRPKTLFSTTFLGFSKIFPSVEV